MKNNFKGYLCVLSICFFIAACERDVAPRDISALSEIRVIDFDDNAVTLTTPANKIVALAPHIVENVFSAGAGDKLVGVMQYSNFPESAKEIPIVGGYEKIDFEKIVELDPDLIIAWQSGNAHTGIQRLIELGFTVYIDQADSLQDVAKSIRDIGALTGRAKQADSVASAYLEQLKQVQNKYENSVKVKSFYQVWNSPLQTISGNHIISDSIEVCGGVNIYADEHAVAPIINIESVLERDPEVIIASGMSSARPEWLNDWQQWESLTAVKQNNLFFVNPDHIQRHTVRLLEGISSICAHLESARDRIKG